MQTEFERSRSQLNWAFLIPPQCGVAACAEGHPGIGKTKTLEALAYHANREFHSYELSRTQPEDLQGFPVVSNLEKDGKDYRYMEFIPDERLLRSELEPSVLLIDEVTNVIAPKQAPALNLIQNPPANCWMFMACNPLDSAADGQPLTCPFINRIWYGEWEIDIEAQDFGLTNRLEYPAPDVPLVPADYMVNQPYWGAIIQQYFQMFPQDRNACPASREEKHKPWPSTRQWHNLSKILAAAGAVRANMDTRDKLITGMVGEKTGTQFIQFVNQLNWHRPEEFLNNPDLFEEYEGYDKQIAVLTSITNYLGSRKANHHETRLDSALAFHKAIEQNHGELASLFMSAIHHLYEDEMRAMNTQSIDSILSDLKV